MSRMSSASAPDPAGEPIVASIVIQISPLPSQTVPDLDAYTKQLTSYIAKNLERFADPRGADISVTVVCKRGTDHKGHQYVSGHYLKNKEENDQ